MTNRVRIDVSDRVAVVTLDDPRRRNALDVEFCDEIVNAFDQLEASTDVGAVVMTGAPPVFCAGANLAHLGSTGSADDNEAIREGLAAVYEGFLRVSRSSLPTVAAVNGAAIGAGMNLALACDLRLAGRSARFDPRFLQLGVHPGGGHCWMSHRVAGLEAVMATVLFGEVLSGEDAARSGLVWRCVDDDHLVPTAIALATRAAKGPRELASRIKATILGVTDVSTHREAVETELVAQVWSLRQPAFRTRFDAIRAKVEGPRIPGP